MKGRYCEGTQSFIPCNWLEVNQFPLHAVFRRGRGINTAGSCLSGEQKSEQLLSTWLDELTFVVVVVAVAVGVDCSRSSRSSRSSSSSSSNCSGIMYDTSL